MVVVDDYRVVNRFSPGFFNNCIRVGMGEIAFGESDINLRIPTISSCIGLVIYVTNLPSDNRIAMMSHIMYASSAYRVNPLNDTIGMGKYADKAIAKMITTLTRRGYQKEDFAAKMAGAINSPVSVRTNSIMSNLNAPAVIEILERENIPIKGSYLGGSKRLELIFKIKTSKLVVIPYGGSTIIL